MIDTTADYSPILYSKEGQVLSMKTAKDGQWRFQPSKEFSSIYETSLLHYEDKNFYYHLGIDPIGLIRAIYLNLTNKKIVSGGSTITMQLARIYLQSKKRNLASKFAESLLAIGLELRYSKKEILYLYSQAAPFGSNVVGIDAAMFRYYNKKLSQLSWAEACLLSVLPNQPSWLHLSKNRQKLIEKRNKLLLSLKNKNVIDQAEYELALLESLPGKPPKIQRLAPHALDYLQKKYANQFVFQSNIEITKQILIQEILLRHNEVLRRNEIRNASAVVINNQNQNVVSYIGNIIADTFKVEHAEVDMIQAPRSSGSVLKPLLMAEAMEDGMLINNSLLPDIPVVINGFRPENFNRTYSGASTVHECIRYSLNIPSILVLKDLGIPEFYSNLQKLGFTTLFREPMEYGLSLVLGGAEVNMWELAKAYSYLMYCQNHYDQFRHQYLPTDSFKLKLLQSESINITNLSQDIPVYSAGTISEMFRSMKNNPYGLGYETSNNQKDFNIAWKTGTSFGYKDAWCIGVTPDYTVCVWVGNSNGLSRPGLIGLETAAPIMFEIMNSLTNTSEWLLVYDDKIQLPICKKSGFKASINCEEIDTIDVPKSSILLKTCPYHQMLFLDKTEKYQVFSDCVFERVEKKYFVLPPLMSFYFQKKDISYAEPPVFHPDCLRTAISNNQLMEFIYPYPNTDVVLPIDLDDQKNTIIFKAVHQDPNAKLFWFLDNIYIGVTEKMHELAQAPIIGDHWLAISDENGHSRKLKFSVRR